MSTFSTASVARQAGELAQRSGRHVGVEGLRQRGLELRVLDGQAVGVGCDHRQLLALDLDEHAGQDRPHLVTRRGAGHALDRLGQRRRRAGSLPHPPPRAGAGNPRRAACFRWKRASPAVSSTSRCSERSSSVTSPSGRLRATSTSRRPGSSTVPSRSICAESTVQRNTHLHIGSAERERAVRSAVNRMPPSDGSVERAETARPACWRAVTKVSRGAVSLHRESLIFLPGSDVSGVLMGVDIYCFPRDGAGRGMWITPVDGPVSEWGVGPAGAPGWPGCPSTARTLVDIAGQLGSRFVALLDRSQRVQDGGVIPVELPGDLRERERRQLPGQEHRELTSSSDTGRALLREEVGPRHAEDGTDRLLDRLDGGRGDGHRHGSPPDPRPRAARGSARTRRAARRRRRRRQARA